MVAAATEGDGLAVFLARKKSPNPFFAGEGEGVAVGEGLAAAATFFLRCLAAGEAAGELASTGVALAEAAGDALAAGSLFLWDLCLAGEGEGETELSGDWAPAQPDSPMTRKNAISFVFIGEA